MNSDKQYVAAEDMGLEDNGNVNILIEQLMENYGPELTNLAFTYVRDWGHAEEIAQDVFFTCFKKIDSFRGEASIKTWLYRITINRSKDALRTWSFRNIQVHPLKAMLSLQDRSLTPEEEAVRRSDDKQLAEILFSLPIKYREVLMLHYYYDLRVNEIRDLIDKNPKTIRTRLRRGRLLMKKMLEEVDENGR